MPWIQLKITITGQLADTLSAALTESGTVSVTFEDTHDTPVYELLQGKSLLWGDTNVIGPYDRDQYDGRSGALSRTIRCLATVSPRKLGSWKTRLRAGMDGKILSHTLR